MKIFHGSLEIIEHPRILFPNRKLDYGEGFYTTTSEKQAEEWVKRRMFEQHANAGYINVYEFDDTAMSMLKTLIFSEPSREWVKRMRTKSQGKSCEGSNGVGERKWSSVATRIRKEEIKKDTSVFVVQIYKKAVNERKSQRDEERKRQRDEESKRRRV